MLANLIQLSKKDYDWVEFIPNVHGSVNVIHHVDKTQEKNHMVISTDVKKNAPEFNTHT